MATQSIRFDFLSTGAASLARDFRSTGDSASSASRGAKVLADVINNLGQKENRTAAESVALAKALRLTGDGADRAAAKALTAEIAVSKLDESMKAIKPADVVILTDKAQAKLDGIRATAEGLKAKFPQFTVQINDKLAKAELALFAADAKDKLGKLDQQIAGSAGGTRGGFAKLAGEITGFGDAATAASSKSSMFAKALAGINLASGLLEPALAGVVVAAGGLASGLAAAGAGLGVFGLVAQSVFAEASKAATAYGTAQAKYASAATSAQRTAALQQEKAAFTGLSAPVKTLALELVGAKSQWQKFTDAAAPGVVSVIGAGLGLLPKILAAMKPFLAPVETALKGIIAHLNTGLSSTGFKSFIDLMAKNTGPAITKIAAAIGHVVVGVAGILTAFMPVSQGMLSGIDKITAKFADWGKSLSGGTGFSSLMTTFKTETPQALAILKNLGVVITNVGKAMFGLSSFSNSHLLLNMLTPLSGVLASLSKNTDLVRVAMYALLAVKIGQQFSWIGPAWQGLVKFAGAAEGAAAKTVIAAAATKVWAGAQAVFNAVMTANPVVLVAAAVIALGVAFYVAWQKSAGFRDVMKIIASGFLQYGIIIVQIYKAIVDGFLSMVGTILHGAATAFGWIPGLGSKLKGASAAFDGFKAGVDNSFNGVISKMKEWQGELDKARSTARADLGVISTAFGNQAKAAGIAKSAVDTYTTAVRQNGVTSQAAKAARDTLAADMIKAGVNGATARAAVAAYTTAIQQNGISSTQAGAARAKLISDILAASSNARQGRTDMDNYSTAVIRNGQNSDAARTARAKLIADLVNSGLSAKGASTLVNNLGANIKALPGSKAMALIMSGKGTYSLSQINAGTGKQQQAAAGWMVTGGTPGKDSVLVRAMPGELIVPTRMVRAGVVDHLRGRIPGFAAGGLVQHDSGGVLSGKLPGVMYADFQKHLTDAMVAGMRAAIKAAIAAAQAAAAKVGGVSGAGPTGGDQATNLKLARSMFPWGASEWPAYNTLEMHEAGYNRFARNSSSGAYGIPQAYPPTKMPFAAQAAGGSHAGPQLSWMFSYIRSVYGTPSAAWAQYYNHPGGEGSYDRGGWLMPGATLAVNNTGRPEQVIPGGGLDGLLAELRALRAEVRQLTGVTAAGPAATGRHVGAAIGGAASSASFRSRYPRGGA